MVIQEELIKKIKNFIKEEKNKKDLEKINITIRQAKTTKSLYIEVSSYVLERKIKLVYRISDHQNSKIKTKIVTKNMKFSFIKRKIQNMIKQIKKIRLEILYNEI